MNMTILLSMFTLRHSSNVVLRAIRNIIKRTEPFFPAHWVGNSPLYLPLLPGQPNNLFKALVSPDRSAFGRLRWSPGRFGFEREVDLER